MESFTIDSAVSPQNHTTSVVQRVRPPGDGLPGPHRCGFQGQVLVVALSGHLKEPNSELPAHPSKFVRNGGNRKFKTIRRLSYPPRLNFLSHCLCKNVPIMYHWIKDKIPIAMILYPVREVPRYNRSEENIC